MASEVDIAIVGMSCRFAGDAKDVTGYWDLLRQGNSAFSPRARFDGAASSLSSSHPGYYLQDDVYKFDASFFGISPKEAKAMDPSQRLMLEVAYEAFESAGLTLEAVSGSNTSVYAAQWACDYRDMMARDLQNAPTYAATGTGTTLLSNRLSWFFDLRGPSLTINTACSSSMVALHEACESLRRGESDMALVAGANVILCPDMFTYLGMQNFLSSSGKCKSFDATGDGYGRGEGIAALVLKRVPTAMEEKSPIRAVIRGTGVNQNGRMKGITLPSVEAQVALMNKTYQSAGLPVTETAYVDAHGTGTQAGDPVELEAIGKVIGQARCSDSGRKVIVGSGKANIGHTEATAGLASVIRSVLILESGLIPPNIYLTQLNPNLRLDEWYLEIPTQLTSWPSGCESRRISVCSTGYGGTNAHAIIDESRHYLQTRGLLHDVQAVRPPAWAAAGQQVVKALPDATGPIFSRPKRFLFNLSSNHEKGVQHELASLAQWCSAIDNEDDNEDTLVDLAYTLDQRRSHFPWRTSITASSISELKEAAETAMKGTTSHSKRAMDDPGLCFVFTGQGAQWPQMGRKLYQESATFRASIDAADKYFRDDLRCSWSAVDELFRDESESRIDEYAFSQPLTTVLQMGLVNLLDEWNVKPDWIIGHSSGEIAGAYCLGALTKQDAWKIAYSCGAFESEQEGSMMAVGLSEHEADSIISQHALGKVVVACTNSPNNVTLAGDSDSLGSLEQLLQSRGICSQRLRVDVAYHSSHMESMAPNYHEAISKVVPSEGIQGRVMFSAVTGKAIEAKDLGPEYWVKNIVSKVKFSEAVSSLMTAFPEREKIFVEIGPHHTMQTPLKRVITSCFASPAQSFEYASLLSRGKDSAATAYTSAGQLFSLGARVNMATLNEPTTGRRPRLIVDLPPYSWRHEDTCNAIRSNVEEQRSHALVKTERAPRRICFSLDWQPAPEFSTEVADEVTKGVTLLLPQRPTQTLRALSGLMTQQLRSAGFHVESAAWPAVGKATQGRKCISLVELDAPIFDNASAGDVAALQRVVSDSKSMLWLSLITPAGSIVPALAQTLRSETPGLQLCSLQVAPPYASRIADLGNIIARLAASDTSDMEFRESQGVLAVPRVNEDAALDGVLQRFLPQQPLGTPVPSQSPDFRLQPDATYVLAGGLGGLGRNIATFMVDLGARHICFLSRSPTASPDTERFLSDLRQRHVSVSAYKCDISDPRSLRSALQQCRHEHPPIKGVIQCAMVLRDVSFQKMTHQQWQEALRPKVQGSANLAANLDPRPQPFFIMLSSFTAVFGNRTQANYVAACAYQDALAHELRRARGLHAVSLRLGIMRDVGYLAQHGATGPLKDWEPGFGLREYEMRALLHAAMAGQTPTQPITGLPTAAAAAAAGLARPFFLDGPKFTALNALDANHSQTAGSNRQQPATPTTAVAAPRPTAPLLHLDRGAPDAREQISTAFFAAIAAALHMLVADVAPTRALHALGADSLTVIEIKSWLYRALGVRLSADELMADAPLSRVVESVWEKWRGGDGGKK
ncbi:type I iterative polyketide synthase [Apiospora rasikravindrae]|uniref:Type I iterative polyketide synthase n=1 Tax=Apiospora rasikravindrae TaxID=990691 RepID=A0ABR1RQH8_9PEZI